MRFAWDLTKAASNLRKHGVSFDEASTVFADSFAATAQDKAHSQLEFRFVTFGLSGAARLLAVCHSDRGQIVRIISARIATRQERKIYEDG